MKPPFFSPIPTKSRKSNHDQFVDQIIVQSINQCIIQLMHLDSHDDQIDDLVLETPPHAFLDVSAHLLEDPTFELAPSYIEDKAPEEHTTSIDPKPCLKRSSPQKDPESFAEPSTPLHQTMNILTQDITLLKRQNEKYAKLISALREENK